MPITRIDDHDPDPCVLRNSVRILLQVNRAICMTSDLEKVHVREYFKGNKKQVGAVKVIETYLDTHSDLTFAL